MKKFTPLIIALASLVFGIVFVVNGIITLKDKDLYDSTVTATVVEIVEEWETSGDPDDPDELVKTAYVDYEVGGKTYEHVRSPEQDSSLKVGDKVEFLYQSKDPSKISGKNITAGGIIFIVAGAAVALFGCFTAIRFFIRGR